MTITIILMASMSILLIFLKHPLSMGTVLILQTILIALYTGMMNNMFWFSYLLILTMLSGMMVLFMYMASIASNEKFYPSIKIFFMIMMTLMLPFFLGDHIEKMKTWSQESKVMVMGDEVMSVISLFNMHGMWVTIMLIMYLLFSMIIVSNIINIKEGPLRMKINEQKITKNKPNN